MGDEEKTYYYRAVPGSRELTTSSPGGDELLKLIEGEEKGLKPWRRFGEEWLGGVKLGADVSLPLAVFDKMLPELTALEQAVFIHLYRLSYGQGLNFCRAGKRELMSRARISDRRLNVALDGLVRRGFIKPLHRSTDGTLYRVFLPSEVMGAPEETGLQCGKKIEMAVRAETRPAPAEKGKSRKTPREKPLESPLNEERFAEVSGHKPKGPTLAEMADSFFLARKTKPDALTRQNAVSVLTGLLEDGFSRDEVSTALQWFIPNQPEEKNLERLPYFIEIALEK